MSLKEELKEEAKIEKKKLKEMSTRDKIWYIWEYYKYHIGALILAIGLICVIINSIYNSTFETGFYTVIINNPMQQDKDYEAIMEDFHDYMNWGKKQLMYTEPMFISYGDAATEYNYASMAKVSTLLAARELDTMICDQENFDHYAPLDVFLDLEELLPEDILPLVQDRFCYGVNSEGQSYAYGIDLSGTDFASDFGLSIEPAICGFIANTERTDACIGFLRYIFVP